MRLQPVAEHRPWPKTSTGQLYVGRPLCKECTAHREETANTSQAQPAPEKTDVEIPLHPTFTSTERIRVNLHSLETLNVNPDRAIGAYMVDNSMIDIIQQGATLAIDRGRTQIIDGEIYAVEHDGMLRIKYLYNRPGGGLRMRSHNAGEHPDEYLTHEQRFEQNFEIVGWVFWWSTLNNRRPPVPLDEHLLGWEGSKTDPEVGN